VNAPYPMLWFDNQAEEAAALYTSLFPDSGVTGIGHSSEGVPGAEAGSVLTVSFTLQGTRLTALNGGPHHTFNEAISLVVECADQAEIDRLWDALIADGGRESQCGWLVDKFGVSWQIVPENISELLAAPGAVPAMLQMTKLDIAGLEAAGAVQG
jgi:predicted 3-demethylubiquinone-9 3-methyltransferase (glyoxalase superfamily)